MTIPSRRLSPLSLPFALTSYAFLSLYFCWPLFTVPEGLGVFDWDQHFFYYGSVLKSLVDYGQLPFWNPWYCGGNVLWQNPQVPLLSPVYPLAMLMSLPLAMKINIVLHYWVGLVGMHLLLTRGLHLRSWPAAMYLSSVGVLAGGLALHLSIGHTGFLPLLYLPLLLYGYVRALEGPHLRHAMGSAALLALMVFNGALHVTQMTLVCLGIVTVVAAAAARSLRPLVVGAMVALLGLAYAAPKLLPVTLWTMSEPFVDARVPVEHPDMMTAEAIGRSLLDRYQNIDIRLPHQRVDWYEYGNYIGVLGAALIAGAAFAVFAMRGTRRWPTGLALALGAALTLAMSAGEFAWWAPASLAQHVPLLSSFRLPSRFTMTFAPLGAACVGWVLAELNLAGLTLSGARPFVALLCVLGAADLWVQNRKHFREALVGAPMEFSAQATLASTAPPALEQNPDPFGPTSPMYRALVANRTFFHCYEPLQSRRVASPDEPLIVVNGRAAVSDITFSPNRIEFDATATTVLAEITLNQNMASGWSSSLGEVVPSSDRGWPAVRLPPGRRGRFAFTFRPPGLLLGTAIATLALLASVALWRRSLAAPHASPSMKVG